MNDTPNGKPHPHDDNWIPACFGPNQVKFRSDEILKYPGKYVAWSWDGTHVVASADSNLELFEKVKSLGLSPSRTVFDYVDPIGEFWA